MKIFTVENDLCDIRIDKYLIDLLGLSRSKIQNKNPPIVTTSVERKVYNNIKK